MTDITTIGKVFRLFRLNYPTFAHGKAEKEWRELGSVWLTMLGRFSEDQLMRAAHRALERPSQYPPTLGEFLALVPRDPAHRYIKDQLPPPPPDEEKLQRYRQQLKDLVDRISVHED